MRSRMMMFFGLCLIMIPGYALGEGRVAKDKVPELGEIVVTATKVESYQAETGSSTTVLTSEDLKKSGKKILLEVLRDVPGLSIVQYGTFGGGTSIYIRGTKPGHTLVMMDGVELNDTMKTDRSVDLAHLLVDNIDRIEIVRGAQSTLYGSDAMGGVINIITRRGEGKIKAEASFEGGSFNTFTEKAGISGSTDKSHYSISAMRLDTDGISKAVGGTEDDGYENTTFSIKAGHIIFEDANLDIMMRYVDTEYDYDDGADQDDPNKVGWWDKLAGKIAFDQVVNTLWDHKITLAYTETNREYKDEADEIDTAEYSHNWYNGDTSKVEWQHNVYPVDWAQVTAGFEYEEEEGYGYGNKAWYLFEETTMDNKACYLQCRFNFYENLFITPGLRMDDNEFFGSEATYKISASYLMKENGIRFKGNWGTGFKAPSLYQLFSPNYGDQNLNPDEGETYDIGFEKTFLDRKVLFSLTYFNNDFENMVEWDGTVFKYQNIDNAQMDGWEIECSFKPMETLTMRGNYTYTNTEDRDTGKELARRSREQGAFSVSWAFIEKAGLNISASYIGERWDDAANTNLMESYTTVDLSAYYDVSEHFQLFGRAENLFDKTFQQISGYAGSDAAYYAGIKASF